MSRKGWFVASCGVYAVMLVVAGLMFPDQVPVHFGASGRADRIVSATQATIEAAVLGLVLAGIFALMAYLAEKKTSLSWVNVRNKDYWTLPENDQRFRAMLRGDMFTMGALVMSLLTVVLAVLSWVAHRSSYELGVGGFLLIGAVVAVLVGHAAYVALWRYRVPPGE